jgi:thioredoxin-dependent peroxiredoxin
MNLDEGDVAPLFTGVTDGGGTVSLEEHRNHKVVLYFYPKDSTPGCTTEACAFREALPDFSKIDAEIIGVSRDSVKRHENFKAKYELTFPLVSDENGAVCEAYGVWVEKMNYGRKYMGIERSTFLIDEQGRIARIWRKVRVNKHVEKVLEEARAL